jgi:hypothetical protein
MMMVVKQPSFVAAVAQGSLNFGEIHANSIVNEASRSISRAEALTKATADFRG